MSQTVGKSDLVFHSIRGDTLGRLILDVEDLKTGWTSTLALPRTVIDQINTGTYTIMSPTGNKATHKISYDDSDSKRIVFTVSW